MTAGTWRWQIVLENLLIYGPAHTLPIGAQ